MENVTICDFCSEIRGDKVSLFNEIYEKYLSNRQVIISDNFVVMPTIGQILSGSVLLLPKLHHDNYSKIDTKERYEALEIVSRLENKLKDFGEIIVFEHGAIPSSGSSCGIYHAHIHLVPMLSKVSASEIIESEINLAESMEDAWNHVVKESEYIVIRDTFGKSYYALPPKGGTGFGSQYIRRRIVELYNLECDWNWRSYKKAEPHLISTINALKD